MTAQISAGQLRDFSTLRAAGLSALAAADVLEMAQQSAAIELASKAYLTEHRGRHGEWTKGAGIPGSQAAAPARRNATALKGIRAAQGTPNMARGLGVSHMDEGIPMLAPANPRVGNVPQTPEQARDLKEQNEHATIQAIAISTSMVEMARQQREIDANQHADMHALLKQVRHANIRMNQLQDDEDGKKAKMKFAVEVGAAIAGAVLAVVTGGLGLPLAGAIAIGLGPTFIMELTELKKQL
jgi:hypothetical protein